MKTIIAGSRSIIDYIIVREFVNRVHDNQPISLVISGTAAGVDRLGEKWALENSIPVKHIPAEWHKYGKAAGHIRNEQMAKLADACIVIWDGESRGSQNMINNAKKYNLHLSILTLV